MKKKNNDVLNYNALIEEKLSQFATGHSLTAPTIRKDEDAVEEFHAQLQFKGFDVHFFFGDFMPYGYSFLERTDGVDIIDEFCFLTRFKFPFSATYYSPYDIHNAINCKDFRTLDFHLIRDKKDLEKSLDVILSFISNNLVAIENIANDLTLQRKLQENYEKDLSVVSKKITPLSFKDDFEKYTVKHEVNLNTHNKCTEQFMTFAYTGKSAPLRKHLEKLSKKSKLLVFEQRFYEYLESKNYDCIALDVKEDVGKKRKSETREKITNILVMLGSAIIAFGLMTIILALYEVNMEESVELIIGSYSKDEFVYAIILLASFFLLSPGIRNVFMKKTFSSEKAKQNEKKTNIIIRLVAAVVIIACSAFAYYNCSSIIALDEGGIYIGSVSENEILPYDTDKVEFFVIEGSIVYDDDGNEQYIEGEMRDVYIVIEGDYENNFSSSAEYGEQVENLISALKEKGIELVSVRDHDSFYDTYVYPEE